MERDLQKEIVGACNQWGNYKIERISLLNGELFAVIE
jgi:hypothetical protein